MEVEEKMGFCRNWVVECLGIGLVALGMGAAWGQSVPAPDTPAGHVLHDWISAFNSADRAKLAAYIQEHDPTQSVDGMLGFESQTGGFDLIKIDASEPLQVDFEVKEKASAQVGFGSLQVKADDPQKVKAFNVAAAPAGAEYEHVTLDEEGRRKVIEEIASKLREDYVDTALAEKMIAGMQLAEQKGDDKSTTDGAQFAKLLTDQMRAVSHDLHLSIRFTSFKQPEEQAGKGAKPSPEEKAMERKGLERSNCDFEKVEVLPGNIGYIRFNAFDDPEICGPTVVSAMQFLAHVDAIIFDLRGNHGGDPKMVSLIASYLFDEPTHLNDLYNRKDNATTQYWSLPYVPGKRLSVPAFVLTSHETFSGGEEFTYDLKELKRATIVGETTGGGAHLMDRVRVDEHFFVGMPGARPINPVSKTDWEGKGVVPDVSVKVDDALTTAEKLASEKIATAAGESSTQK